MTLRNRTLFGDYDRGYQNFVPGAVTADKTLVALTAYNNATQRAEHLQPDRCHATSPRPARIRHTLLGGAEFGRQLTDNFRNTGFFNNAATSILVPLRESDDHDAGDVPPERDRRRQPRAHQRRGGVRAGPGRAVPLRAGDRRRALRPLRSHYHNNRNGDKLGRVDNLVSPRAGVVFKPIDAALALRQLQRLVSAQLRRSVLVADGDHAAGEAGEVHQLRSRREVGCRPAAVADHGASTGSIARTRASTDPNDPTRIVQTGSQRTNGYELGINGQLTRAWTIAGGYALPERVRHQRDGRRARRRAGRPGAAPHVLALEQLPARCRASAPASASSSAPTCSRLSTIPSRCPATRGRMPRSSCR